jgi:hypothetical protein
VTDFLDQRRKEITDRLKELKPLVDEFNRLEAAAVALAEAVGSAVGSAASNAGSAAVATATRRRGSGRSRGSSTAKKAPGRPKGSGKKVGRPAGTGKKVGRPPGSGKVGRPQGKVGRPAGKVASPTKARRGGRPKGGKRAAEALSFVQGQPGITIPELAAKMGIKQNYLYRVLPGLEQEGKLQKKGRGWYPKAA